jgi:nitroreductase
MTMDYDSLLALVKKRRSIRRFKPDPIPDEYIEKIIDVARWAPSGFNMQPWEFVVVKKAELRKKIVELVEEIRPQTRQMETAREPWQGKTWEMTGLIGGEMDYSTAPVFILLFGDPRTNVGLPMNVRYDSHKRDIIYTSSIANAFLYLHLAATTLDLATQWISAVQTPYVHCMIKKLLGIPFEMEVFDMIALGYPALKPRPKLMRDIKNMIHYDDCGEKDFRDIEAVREFAMRARNWNIGTHRRE